MKYMIASDIHGSAYYCRAMLERYAAEHADRLILLGDLLYHGPRNDLPREYAPKDVIDMLNAHAEEILCVRGNCEAEVDQMVLRFPVLAEYALLELNGHMLFLTHGHHFHAEALPPLHAGDMLLHGHTHIPLCTQKNGIAVLNPGSVSIPKEGSPNGYMLLENGRFTWKTLDGAPYHTWDAGTQPQEISWDFSAES